MKKKNKNPKLSNLKRNEKNIKKNNNNCKSKIKNKTFLKKRKRKRIQV